jgi:FKBP-type peptidyl-prolyl cis-trans isomerase FkpA
MKNKWNDYCGTIFSNKNHMIKRNAIKHFVMLSGMVVVALLSSCDPSINNVDLQEQEQLNIGSFLSANDTLDFERKASGLYYLDLSVGTGPIAEANDTAYVFYAMQYLSGVIFDTNYGTSDTLIFKVNGGKLIPGFAEGVTYMREGGKSIFLTPSNLAYGSEGNVYVSPYTPFIFQVYLVRLVKSQGSK